MGKRLFANNAVATLAEALTAEAQTLTLSAGSGVRFPDVDGSGDFFTLTLIGMDANGNENSWEIVRVISREGDTLTIERGQESTPVKAWGGGTRAELRLTAEGLSVFASEDDVSRLTSGKLDKTGGMITGTITSARYDNGLSTATTVIDWRNGQHQRLTLNGNVKLEFIPPDDGVFIGSLKLINNAATTRAITWPAGVLRLGSVAPQSPDAKVNAVGRYAVMWDGEWEVSGGRFG